MSDLTDSPCVLVVADRERVGEIVAALSELPNVEIVVSSGGDDTIELFAARRPAVVVVTASLLHGDARSLIATLRGQVPRGEVAIVVIGDDAGPVRTPLDALDLAPDRFVTRPLSSRALRFAVTGGIDSVELVRSAGPMPPRRKTGPMGSVPSLVDTQPGGAPPPRLPHPPVPGGWSASPAGASSAVSGVPQPVPATPSRPVPSPVRETPSRPVASAGSSASAGSGPVPVVVRETPSRPISSSGSGSSVSGVIQVPVRDAPSRPVASPASASSAGSGPVPQPVRGVPQPVRDAPSRPIASSHEDAGETASAARAALRARWEALADSMVGPLPDDDPEEPAPPPQSLVIKPRRRHGDPAEDVAPAAAWKPGSSDEIAPQREPTLILREPATAGPPPGAAPAGGTAWVRDSQRAVPEELPAEASQPASSRTQTGDGSVVVAARTSSDELWSEPMAIPAIPDRDPRAGDEALLAPHLGGAPGADGADRAGAADGDDLDESDDPFGEVTARREVPRQRATAQPAEREAIDDLAAPSAPAREGLDDLAAPPSSPAREALDDLAPPSSPAREALDDLAATSSAPPRDASAEPATTGSPPTRDAIPETQAAPSTPSGGEPRDFARELRAKMSMMAQRLFQGDAPASSPGDHAPRHDHHTEIDLAALGDDTPLGAMADLEARGQRHELRELATSSGSSGTWDTQVRDRGLADSGAIVRGVSDAAMLLAKLFAQGATGRIGFRRDEVETIVYFDRGRPVFASSNEPRDRMGELLLREGKITASQLERCQAVVAESGRRMGEILVDFGYLKRRELLPAVRRHVEDLVYSLFGWDRGSYAITLDPQPSAERIRLSRHPASLILEGIRRKLDRTSLERLIGPPSTVIEVRDRDRLGGIVNLGDLAPEERGALAAFDGQADLAQVARSAGVDIADVLPLAWGLCVLGLATARRSDSELSDEATALVGETDLAIDRERVRARWQLVTEADYFALLGVRRDATGFEIRRAYQSARRDFAADCFPSDLRRELARELDDIAHVLDEAFRVLRDDRLRQTYLANLVDR